jgi:organic radical activating enzyme
LSNIGISGASQTTLMSETQRDWLKKAWPQNALRDVSEDKCHGNKYYSALSIITHAVCNLSCEHCSVMPWMMKYGKDYEMTMENVKNFVFWTKKSGYFFERICLTGGEPLLWDNIIDKLKIIVAEKGIIYKELNIQTNLLKLTEANIGWFKDILALVDGVRVSMYLYNNKAVDISLNKLTSAESEKISYVERSDAFMKRLLEPVPDSLPAICGCPDYNLYGDGVDICGGGRPIATSMGKTIEEDYPYYHAKIDRVNYLDQLNSYSQFKQEFCQYCVVNTKNHSAIELAPNKNKKYKELEDMDLIKNYKIKNYNITKEIFQKRINDSLIAMNGTT